MKKIKINTKNAVISSAVFTLVGFALFNNLIGLFGYVALCIIIYLKKSKQGVEGEEIEELEYHISLREAIGGNREERKVRGIQSITTTIRRPETNHFNLNDYNNITFKRIKPSKINKEKVIDIATIKAEEIKEKAKNKELEAKKYESNLKIETVKKEEIPTKIEVVLKSDETQAIEILRSIEKYEIPKNLEENIQEEKKNEATVQRFDFKVDVLKIFNDIKNDESYFSEFVIKYFEFLREKGAFSANTKNCLKEKNETTLKSIGLKVDVLEILSNKKDYESYFSEFIIKYFDVVKEKDEMATNEQKYIIEENKNDNISEIIELKIDILEILNNRKDSNSYFSEFIGKYTNLSKEKEAYVEENNKNSEEDSNRVLIQAIETTKTEAKIEPIRYVFTNEISHEKIEEINIFEKAITINTLPSKPINRDNETALLEKMETLEQVLREYGIIAHIKDFQMGPVISRIEIGVEIGTRVKRVVSLQDDIAMHLQVKSIRIEAPIPGKNAIGIEIPNDVPEMVLFSEIIKENNLNNRNSLDVVLGKNIIGENVIVNLKKMPHLLIAGRTGAGKSVCINTLISSLLITHNSDTLKMIMIDPKMVELMPFNSIPHLLTPVITEPKLAPLALKWAVNEMESRYKILSQLMLRNIDSYNEVMQKTGQPKMPYIVIVIDELADLMMTAPASIEESIARIAQKARAIGIHLVVATQRPSVDVITGTIKANLPSRISFAVSSQIDSRTILDTSGAEKLLGKGDMLLIESGASAPVRIQGAYIKDEEINELVEKVSGVGLQSYIPDIIEDKFEANGDKDELFEKALELYRELKEKDEKSLVSISLIQRKLKIGFNRAARICDQIKEFMEIEEV